MKKSIIKIVTLLLVVALPLALLAGCEGIQSGEYTNAYVSVSINPEIEMAVDEDGNVEAVYCVNEDAEILLVDTNLEGQNVEDAIETFVGLATEAGFIDVAETDNEVVIDVITGDEEEEQEVKQRMQQRIQERIHKYFDNNGIFGRVSEETLDKYAEQAAELGVPLGKTKMILRALEINPLLDIEELKDMPMKELAKGLGQKAKTDVNAGLREEFKQEREAIFEEYPELALLRQEIDALKIQLSEYEGDEQGRTDLENQLQAKIEECEALREEVKEEVDALAEEYRELAQEKAAEQREQAQQRKEENRAKVEEHRDNVTRSQKREVKNWREKQKQ